MARSTRVDDVVEFIIGAIESGRFPIGEQLPGEEQLAKLADASRLTLREAVKTLAAHRVLNPVQGRGTFVNPPAMWLSLEALMRVQEGNHVDALLQLVEVRGFLEIGATERFARVARPEQVAELRSHLDAMVAANARGDVESVMEADLAFHQVIIDGSGNPYIAAAMAPLARVLAEARRATSGVPEIRANAIAEHTKVLEAISRGDAPAARKAMRSHMRQTADDTRLHLASPSA